LKYFIGIELAYSHGNVFLSQRKYVLNLLKKTKKLDCKPSSTPIDSKKKLSTEEGTVGFAICMRCEITKKNYATQLKIKNHVYKI
jgi:hypothetical protein